MIINEDDYNSLAHYGILRKSGRYPWGSGATQRERNRTFLGTIDDLRAQGLTDPEIARGFGMTSTKLRDLRSIAKNAEKQADIAMAQRLKDRGWSNVKIGERMGINESSVRALLAPEAKRKADILTSTSNMLKEHVAEKGLIDVGKGVEYHLNISKEKLGKAVRMLQEEGYTLHYVPVEQLGTGKRTTIKVLAAPKTTYSEVHRNRENIQQVMGTFTDDGGLSYKKIQPPLNVSSKRIQVRYAEEGGKDADGVIYVRSGVKDLSLDGSSYAQGRIAVDGTHYLKGMVIPRDDLPAGVDVVFNTNKSDTGNKLDAMKPMKKDKDGNIDQGNPFGSAIKRQIFEPGSRTKLTSAINIVNEEGDWDKWSRNLSSQMLSKQTRSLAAKQLEMAYESKRAQLDEILALENPVIKKKLLESFADDADSSAVTLKGAALPRQSSHVILPLSKIKENEVYAPNFRDGELVVLIRHPHGGRFEIPELRVNNRNPEGKKIIGPNSKDAIGIHSKVAERLSGADFDGDTVLVIPNNRRLVKTESPLEGLEGFDTRSSYPGYPGMARLTKEQEPFEMGDVSNLITDMSLRGASNSELARAVRHSMVVIDAEKHGLNYKQSAIDNGIADLKTRYQGSPKAGASTVISRASSRLDVRERKARPMGEGGPIDAETGKKVYVETGANWVNSKGKTVYKTERSTKLAETDDAHTLSSGLPMEKIYADHSNSLKALANEARLASLKTGSIPYSPEARRKYASEVASLDADLALAKRNAPLERQAQVLANVLYRQKRDAYPDMDTSEIKKQKFMAQEEARNRVGASKQRIKITDEQWEAIQAGAITKNKLTEIIANSDLDRLKELATPKETKLMTPARLNLAAAMLRAGYTRAEVADHFGVSVSTLKSSLS